MEPGEMERDGTILGRCLDMRDCIEILYTVGRGPPRRRRGAQGRPGALEIASSWCIRRRLLVSVQRGLLAYVIQHSVHQTANRAPAAAHVGLEGLRCRHTGQGARTDAQGLDAAVVHVLTGRATRRLGYGCCRVGTLFRS